MNNPKNLTLEEYGKLTPEALIIALRKESPSGEYENAENILELIKNKHKETKKKNRKKTIKKMESYLEQDEVILDVSLETLVQIINETSEDVYIKDKNTLAYQELAKDVKEIIESLYQRFKKHNKEIEDVGVMISSDILRYDYDLDLPKVFMAKEVLKFLSTKKGNKNAKEILNFIIYSSDLDSVLKMARSGEIDLTMRQENILESRRRFNIEFGKIENNSQSSENNQRI